MMTQHAKDELRDRLLAEQASDPHLKLEYERKLNAMFEIQLTPLKKVWFTALIGFALISGALVLTLALTEPLRPLVRTALLSGVAFAAAWIVFLGQLLRRGTMRRRIDPPMAAGMAFVFALMMCILMAIAGAPMDQVILTAMLFLFPAGLMVLRTVVEQSEMRTQEHLVELQYRLARLEDRLDDGELGAGVPR